MLGVVLGGTGLLRHGKRPNIIVASSTYTAIQVFKVEEDTCKTPLDGGLHC